MILKELLTEKEIWILNEDILSKEYKDLTIENLINLSFILIETEYKSKMPECILPAKAIEILVERAKKMDIALR
jgi:hypothetical protein